MYKGNDCESDFIMSLYAEYIKEVYGKNMIETDELFIIWTINGEILYLEDMYIKPELRNKGLGQNALAWIISVARENGCKEILISLMESCKFKNENMQIYLHVGFELHSFKDQIIYLKKKV